MNLQQRTLIGIRMLVGGNAEYAGLLQINEEIGDDVPNKPRGTVKGHKITPAQQRLFGTARGLQESGQSSKTAAGKIAKTIEPKDLHTIASKPKSGYRKLGKKK